MGTTHPPPLPPADALVVGVDVAKDKLDLARSDTDRVPGFTNDPAGIRAVVEGLAAATPGLIVVVEATARLTWASSTRLSSPKSIAAIRFNPGIRAFSDRLKAAGKVSEVRIVACMRKLLTLMNAMARDGLAWDQLDAVKKLVPTP